jgi:hypothetical protein
MATRIEPPTGAVRTDDWPAQATDAIVTVVGVAHDKVTGPIHTIARAIVFGLFALILGIATITLLSILVGRVLNNWLPDAIFGEDHMWAVHGLLGLLFVLVGGFAWTKRKPQPAAAGA